MAGALWPQPGGGPICQRRTGFPDPPHGGARRLPPRGPQRSCLHCGNRCAPLSLLSLSLRAPVPSSLSLPPDMQYGLRSCVVDPVQSSIFAGLCSAVHCMQEMRRGRDALWTCEEPEDHGLCSAACRERWVVEEMHCVAFGFFLSTYQNGEAEEHSKNTAITLLWEFGHSHSHIPKPAHCSMDSCVDHAKHPDVTPQKSAPTEEQKRHVSAGWFQRFQAPILVTPSQSDRTVREPECRGKKKRWQR